MRGLVSYLHNECEMEESNEMENSIAYCNPELATFNGIGTIKRVARRSRLLGPFR